MPYLLDEMAITSTKCQQSKQSSSRKSFQLNSRFLSSLFKPARCRVRFCKEKTTCKSGIKILLPIETLSRLTGRWNIFVGRYCLTPPLLPPHLPHFSTTSSLSLTLSTPLSISPPEGSMDKHGTKKKISCSIFLKSQLILIC